MTTLTIELPETVKQFLSEKVQEGGYQTASEYIVELLEVCQNRDRIENKLLEAIESNRFEEVTADFWEQLRDRVDQSKDQSFIA